MRKDMFSPLSANEKITAKKSRKQKDQGVAIMPVPDDVEHEMSHHFSLGAPSIYWEYKDSEGKTLFYVARFIDEHGEKQDRPISYREYPDGSRKWAWKGVETPRPLYGLDRLALKPDAPVIICEGEKATDAATIHFPDYVCMTSPNGAGSPHKADWEPLKGREVMIWPDHDDEGLKYAKSVANQVKKIGCQSVSIINVPDCFPKKWDLADDLPEGKRAKDLIQMIQEADLVLDPLENLVERSKLDLGEPFKPDVSEALSELKKNDRAAYETLRSKLKSVKVRVTALDKHLIEKHDDNEEDHLDLARLVIDAVGGENLIGTSAHIWKWRDSGVWRLCEDRALKQLVQSALEDNGDKIFRGTIDAVTEVLKTEIYSPDHIWNENKSIINVQNGELCFGEFGWVLSDHNRESYCSTQIPIIYDPEADCPRFKQFLDEIFVDDGDKEQKAQAVLEMMGYTLVSHAKYERFALLVGSGSNGKSVVLDLIRALVGAENVAAVQPTQFGNKFQRAHLHLKLANLVTEIPEGGEIADAELKAITSGELTTAEHKNQNPFDFCPFCTCWFGTNHMPHTRDFSDALFRRALVIPFNRKFVAGVDADPNLKTDLLKELPGIMNLALGAYRNVIKTNNFTEPQSCIDAKSAWRLEADQVAQFVQERCVLKPNYEVSSSDLYEAYKIWADDAGISKKMGRRNFTNRLVRLGCSLSKGTAGTRLISGIRIGWER